MKKMLSLSLSLLASIAMINPTQAMNAEKKVYTEACSETRSNLRDFLDPANGYFRLPVALSAELLNNAMKKHTDCINKSTRNFCKSNVSKAERVEEVCSPLQSLFLNAKDSEFGTALAKYEACLKHELAKLHEQKKQNRQ